MSKDVKLIAKEEVHSSLGFCNFFMRRIGLSFIDELPKTFWQKCNVFLSFLIASSLLIFMMIGQDAFIVYMLMNSISVENLIGSYLHIAGYDTISVGKLLTIWYKKTSFRRIVVELTDIWVVSDLSPKAAAIKRDSLNSLKNRQALYIFWNVLGVWLFNLTPIVLLLYRWARGLSADLGYIWQIYYPFDKTKPFVHEFVYLFETFSGVASVWCTLSSDLFFITMSSNISMLLRLLQERIRNIGTAEGSEGNSSDRLLDYYQEIMNTIKIHQRLISYRDDLEDAFSLVLLINVLLSSVNICCAVFSIVFMQPWMEISNKFFLGAVMTQMGILCWYADDIYRASLGVSDAVYESGWYRCDIRSRRALLMMLQRSQRPLYFTALKFSNITLRTYTSILSTSYSYFALLYTAYRR